MTVAEEGATPRFAVVFAAGLRIARQDAIDQGSGVAILSIATIADQGLV